MGVGKSYTLRILTAGRLQKRILTPRIQRGDSDRARAAKKKKQSEGQRLRNVRHSWEKLELQLAANYDSRDLWIVGTFRDGEEPTTEAQRAAISTEFNRRMRAERRKVKAEWRCHWNWENKSDEGRWHTHIAANATGDDLETLQRCWTWGKIRVEPLRIDGGEWSYEKLARYLCKERSAKKPGEQCWHHTRNIRRVEVETYAVEADETLQAPRGAVVLDSLRSADRYGRLEYLKLLLPETRRAPRARRRRRKR